MWGVSSAFLTEVGRSHHITHQVTVGPWSGPQTDISRFVLDGTVNVSRTSAVRRTCTLQLGDVDGAVVPQYATDALAPTAGQFLRVYRGVKYADGTTETAPLGVFRIVKTTPSQDGDGISVAVEGADLAWPITRSTWTLPWAIAAGTYAEWAIAAIVTNRLPVTIAMQLQPTGYQLPALIYGLGGEESSDPWTACQTIATDAGYDLYFDQAGKLVMNPTPSPASAPILTYEAETLPVVLTAAREWDGEQMYNGVIVISENPVLAAPLRAEAWDTNPGSPTYRWGALGEMAEVVNSDRILTQAQAQAAAYERLKRRQGRGVALSWTQIVNPALDAGDVVRVVRPGLKLDDQFVIDSLDVPLLAANAMTGTGRTTASIVVES